MPYIIAQSRTKKNFLKYNILCLPGILLGAVHDHRCYIRCCRQCNIELAMCEDRKSQVNTNVAQGLALRLIDGHGERQVDRELNATDAIGHGCRWFLNKFDSWDKNNIPGKRPAGDPALEDPLLYVENNQSGSVAEAVCGRKISEQADGTTDFEL